MPDTGHQAQITFARCWYRVLCEQQLVPNFWSWRLALICLMRFCCAHGAKRQCEVLAAWCLDIGTKLQKEFAWAPGAWRSTSGVRYVAGAQWHGPLCLISCLWWLEGAAKNHGPIALRMPSASWRLMPARYTVPDAWGMLLNGARHTQNVYHP